MLRNLLIILDTLLRINVQRAFGIIGQPLQHEANMPMRIALPYERAISRTPTWRRSEKKTVWLILGFTRQCHLQRQEPHHESAGSHLSELPRMPKCATS